MQCLNHCNFPETHSTCPNSLKRASKRVNHEIEQSSWRWRNHWYCYLQVAISRFHMPASTVIWSACEAGFLTALVKLDDSPPELLHSFHLLVAKCDTFQGGRRADPIRYVQWCCRVPQR